MENLSLTLRQVLNCDCYSVKWSDYMSVHVLCVIRMCVIGALCCTGLRMCTLTFTLRLPTYLHYAYIVSCLCLFRLPRVTHMKHQKWSVRLKYVPSVVNASECSFSIVPYMNAWWTDGHVGMGTRPDGAAPPSPLPITHYRCIIPILIWREISVSIFWGGPTHTDECLSISACGVQHLDGNV